MSFFARTKNISRSSQVSKVGQGFLQVLDLYLMSTNSAAGWICLASLHSCMNCTSTSSYGKDTKLYTVCLAELLWGFTLKALQGMQLQPSSQNLASSFSMSQNLHYPKIFMSTDWPHAALSVWWADVNCLWTVCGYLLVISTQCWSLTVLWELSDAVEYC